MKEKILEKLAEYLQKTGDFIIEESPEVIQQALKYHLISTISSACLCTILIILFCFGFYYFYQNKDSEKYSFQSGVSLFLCFMLPFLAFGCFVQVIKDIDNLIKIVFAPKYFIISLFM